MAKVHIHVHNKVKDVSVGQADRTLAEIEREINRVSNKADVLARHAYAGNGPENTKSQTQLEAILAKLKQT